MNAIWTAIVLAAVGVALCLWLILRASWYSFFVFMLVAQPPAPHRRPDLAGAVARELRRKGVL